MTLSHGPASTVIRHVQRIRVKRCGPSHRCCQNGVLVLCILLRAAAADGVLRGGRDRALRDPDYDSHLGLQRDPETREIVTVAQHT